MCFIVIDYATEDDDYLYTRIILFACLHAVKKHNPFFFLQGEEDSFRFYYFSEVNDRCLVRFEKENCYFFFRLFRYFFNY